MDEQIKYACFSVHSLHTHSQTLTFVHRYAHSVAMLYPTTKIPKLNGANDGGGK